jgi:SAM-dependent methyltransferase
VFSNAALHWVRAAGEAVESVRRALKPGGRFVGEFGGVGNIAAIRAALWTVLARRGVDASPLDPWYFPSDAEYRMLLERHGFAVRFISLFSRPTPLPTDMTGWLTTFAAPFLGVFGDDARALVVEEIAEQARPQLYDPSIGWSADYVRLRFAAEQTA